MLLQEAIPEKSALRQKIKYFLQKKKTFTSIIRAEGTPQNCFLRIRLETQPFHISMNCSEAKRKLGNMRVNLTAQLIDSDTTIKNHKHRLLKYSWIPEV
jgi:hypothetical protein